MEAMRFESKFAYAIEQSQTLKNAMVILAGSFLIALAAQITLPIQPVPITLQTFAVLFVGMFFGPKVGSKMVLAYLCEGCCSLPVFANFSGGLHVLFGPTGGYLLGFVPATILTGYLLQMGLAKYRITIFLAASLGTILLFIPGYLVLAKFTGYRHAYTLGVAPFYIIELFKLTILTIITPFFWRQKS